MLRLGRPTCRQDDHRRAEAARTGELEGRCGRCVPLDVPAFASRQPVTDPLHPQPVRHPDQSGRCRYSADRACDQRRQESPYRENHPDREQHGTRTRKDASAEGGYAEYHEPKGKEQAHDGVNDRERGIARHRAGEVDRSGACTGAPGDRYGSQPRRSLSWSCRRSVISICPGAWVIISSGFARRATA